MNDNRSELIAEAKMWDEPGVTPIGEARLILDLAAEVERMHKVYLKLVEDLSTEQVENKLLKQKLTEQAATIEAVHGWFNTNAGFLATHPAGGSLADILDTAQAGERQ